MSIDARRKRIAARFFKTPAEMQAYFRSLHRDEMLLADPSNQANDPRTLERQQRIQQNPEEQVVLDALLVSQTFLAVDGPRTLPEDTIGLTNLRIAVTTTLTAVTSVPGRQILGLLLRIAGQRKIQVKCLAEFMFTRGSSLISTLNDLVKSKSPTDHPPRIR